MSLEPDDQDYERLARYLAGESTAAEAAEVEAWISADPGHREMADALRAAWQGADGRSSPAARGAVDKAWARMAARIDADPAMPGRTQESSERPLMLVRDRPPSHPARRSWAMPTRIAAGIALVVGGGLLWRGTRPGSSGTVAPPRPVLTVTQSHSTAAGERRTVTLDDGTEVMLSVGTRLDVAATYGAGARDVVLDGEARFRVRHDAARPFRVHTAGGTIEDLGTEFVIRRYGRRATDTIRVTVTEGSVALRSVAADARASTVSAGETGWLPPAGNAIVKRTTDARAALAWTEGHLVLDNVTMDRAAEELARWFGVHVVLRTPGLETRHFSTTGLRAGMLSEAVMALAALPARVEFHGDTLSIFELKPPR